MRDRDVCAGRRRSGSAAPRYGRAADAVAERGNGEPISTRRPAWRRHHREGRQCAHFGSNSWFPGRRRRAVRPHERHLRVESRRDERRQRTAVHRAPPRRRRSHRVLRREQWDPFADIQAGRRESPIRPPDRSRLSLSGVHRSSRTTRRQHRRHRGPRRHDRAGARDAHHANERRPPRARPWRHPPAGAQLGWQLVRHHQGW